MRKFLVGFLLIAPLLAFEIAGASPRTMPEFRMESAIVLTEDGKADGGVKYVLDSSVERGKVVEGEAAEPGYIEKRFARLFVDGKLNSEKLVGERIIDPSPKTLLISPEGFESPHTAFTHKKTLTMEATAYTPDAGLGSRATFRTRTGRRAEFGVVAVDPRVIPLNTMVYVEGYGLALACDTGGAIKGNRIDICVEGSRTARIWGRRNTTVHVFNETVGNAWVP